MKWLIGVVIACLSIFSSKIAFSTADCPPADVLTPCTCLTISHGSVTGDSITCNVPDTTDIKPALQRLSDSQTNPHPQRHFFVLNISNPVIESIDDSDLIPDGLTFDRVYVYQCHNLKRINSSVFDKTAQTVEYIAFGPSPLFSIAPAPYNFFDYVNSFVNLEKAWINNINITHIPEDAFNQSNYRLRVIEWLGSVNLTNRVELSDRAFYSLNNLTHLSIKRQQIDHFPREAFKFRNETNATLNLFIDGNILNSSIFSNGWLSNVNRPVAVNLKDNRITYLDQTVFQPFLDDRVKANRISDLRGNPLNCSDCRNAWLKRGRAKYETRIERADCDGHLPSRKFIRPTVFDSAFGHCDG